MKDMNELEELYAKRAVSEEYGMPVPESLANKIAWYEMLMEEKTIDAVGECLPKQLDLAKAGRFVFVAVYEDGKLANVGCGNAELSDDEICSFWKEVDSQDEPEGASEDDVDTADNPTRRSKSIGFTVMFADGKVVRERTAQATLIETLKHIGLERASKYKGEIFAGFPLVGKEQRITNPPHCWQKKVDGWWVYINMKNSRAIDCIKGVAKMLNISLQIVLDDSEHAQNDVPAEKAKGGIVKYSFNDEPPLGKSHTVLRAVRQLLEEFPTLTFADVERLLPKDLQGSYGVVISMDEYKERSARNQSEYRRWFLDDILTAGDGVRFAVSTQWGDNFSAFRSHVILEFGWTIEEA